MESRGRFLIFVYGTLMRGGCRHGALAGQRFLGVGQTQAIYRLLNCGDYPGLVDAHPGRSIHGEVWEVDEQCLRRLDEVEGVSEGLYERRTVQVMPPSWDRPVEAYFYLRSAPGMPDCGDRWTNPL